MGTKAIWVEETEVLPGGALVMPELHSVTYAYHDLDEWYEVTLGDDTHRLGISANDFRKLIFTS